MADDQPPAGRRRHLDQVGDELAALRRDLREQSGLLAEALPLLDDLDNRLARVQAQVTGLVASQEAHAEENAADKAARRAVGMWNDPPGPWSWPTFDRTQAQTAWDALARWTGEILCSWYVTPRGALPDCWPRHRPAVLELTALRQAHVEAHSPGAAAHRASDWHLRHRPGALAAIAERVPGHLCRPGAHLLSGDDEVAKRERERMGAEPSGSHLWLPALREVAAADVAARRAPPSEAPT